MKKLFILAVMLFAVVLVKAQDPMFLKEDKVVNLGIGLGYYGSASVSASLDYCIADGILENGSIGVGPYVGFGLRTNYTDVLFGARGTFHYPFIDDLDTYVGFGLGARISKYRYYTGISPHLNGGFFLGARYGINETLTVFGELGSGINYLNVGIALNF